MIVCLVGAAATAHANRRVALVVGNSAYAYGGALENPVNDAKAPIENQDSEWLEAPATGREII